MNLTYLSLHCIIDCNNTHMMYWHFVFCKVNQSYHLLWDKQKVKSLEFVKKGKKNTLRNWNVNAANYFLVFWLKLDQTTRDLTFIILSVTHQSVYKKNDFFHILFCSFLYSNQKYQNSKLWRYNSWRLPFLWVLWHFIWTRSWKCSRMSRKMHFSKIVQKILQVFWIFWQQGTYNLHIHCSITT